MTIDEAIEIQNDIEPAKLFYFLNNEKQAFRLGIAALKEIKHLHESQVLDEDELLPGETEE